MLFLNIIKQSPTRFHSNDLYQRGSEQINHIIEAFKNNSWDIKESANTLIAPLFELYMDHSEVVFNSLSKALALDYYQNRSSLKHDVADRYSRMVNLHSNIWQES
jgi:Txe/YoeB family toxin of Txe-Axe toxin-antitoxin module